MIEIDFFQIENGKLPKVIPSLISSHAHIWQIAIESDSTWDDALLTQEEKNRANRYYFEKDKIQYSITQSFLKIILSSYTKTAPEQLKFVRGPHGKPALLEPFSQIKFNLSHSHHMILYALTLDDEIGVDVEYLKRSLTAMHGIVESNFNLKEQQEFYRLPEAERAQYFLATWTLKEAYLKAIGTGIINELHQIEWNILNADHPAQGTVKVLAYPECRFVQFRPTNDYVGTVVLA